MIAQRFFNRTGEEFRGNFCSPSESPANFKAARLTAYFLTSFAFLAYLASWDFFAIKNNGSEERANNVSPSVCAVKPILKPVWSQTGMFCDTREHAWTDFFAIVKGESIVRPANS